MLDFELGFHHVDVALVELVRDLALLRGKGFGPRSLDRADRDDGQARVDLGARDRRERRRAQERLLAIRMRDASGGANEARVELDPRRATLQLRTIRPHPAHTPAAEKPTTPT